MYFSAALVVVLTHFVEEHGELIIVLRRDGVATDATVQVVPALAAWHGSGAVV